MRLQLFVAGVTLALSMQAEVDFVRDVQPILRKRCLACHGAVRPQSGLRLDTREHALEGGYSGAVLKPGDSANSKLYRVVAGKDTLTMPPGGGKLPQAEVDTFRSWIDEGARWPAMPNAAPAFAATKLWSFQPLHKPALPDSTVHPVDAFVLTKLHKQRIQPSPEAPRHTLLRRLYLDLTGLPPTPADLVRTEPYVTTVDRLLASPHFGEKWARMWLDLARYADSDGYEQDQVRPHAWRYRQWVIDAFNRNMPFDQFTVEQVAGDLLPNATIAQLTAAGFHRNTLTSREGGIDVEQLRTEQVTDRAITTGSVWLGLTFECTRCHDHKYDPITQRDFYRFYAFFNSIDEINLTDPLPGERGRFEKTWPEYKRQYDEIAAKARVAELQPKWEAEVMQAMQDPAARLEWTQVLDYVAVYQDRGHDMLRTPPAQRTFRQSHDLTRVFLKYPGPLASWPEVKGVRFGEGFQKLEDLDASYPGLSEIPSVRERSAPRESHIFLRGDFRNPGIAVTPGTPESLPPLESPPTRLALAKWLVSPTNPLTARVTVNRFWQELFGRGLVTTPEDFGTRGDAPTHPELLDYLAATFRDSGWDMKGLIRLIVTSQTYKQSSRTRTDIDDPDNRLLARQNRFRLPAELVRDAALSASGLLNPTVGGPSFRPPIPAGALKVAYRVKWQESQGPDRYRRGLYTFLQRSLPHPQLMNFDAPSSLVSCSRRTRSVTPLQALNLLNAPEFTEAAAALAKRVETNRSGGFDEQARYAFELCLSRTPSPEEIVLLRNYYNTRRNWTGVAAALLNLDEFITRE
ncbi:MAG: PSD1 domain-containing protein [Bryobacterales bacterium]|nr:PSD1 domain-containing protein [Bryobacterales bacterium]